MKESLEFYNQFDDKLIQDYAKGNKRIKSAIENLAKFIPLKEHIDVLDIGCGIGWSTFEFSRFFKNATVHGIDLSPVLIKIAKKMFENQNLSYSVYNILKNTPQNKFDVIVMIDVYEHIPIIERSNFHISLQELLKPNGRLVLACPSVYHQNYLKANNPKGLQPVDEDVDLIDIQRLGKEIGGEVIYFEYKSIWRNYDYFYAVIQRNVEYDSILNLQLNENFEIENKNTRCKKLKDNLGIVFPSNYSNGFLKRIVKKIRTK